MKYKVPKIDRNIKSNALLIIFNVIAIPLL